MLGHSFIITVVVVLLALVGHPGQAGQKIDFNRDIRPILSDRCFQCHGADEAARQAGLRFDVPDDQEGPFRDRDSSPALVPHDLQASGIWYRLTTDDPEEAMPPADSHKEPLSAEQKDLIKQWILQGAGYDEFWAFAPPKSQDVPQVANTDWSERRIDQFVLARLEEAGLQPQERADKRTLLRRVTFDLTGLPPTREEIHAYLEDESDGAYERVVDRLLGRPQHGEHMAKYWLDLVRFADTNGLHHDHYREMTPYRDWVIRSFNDGIPFDEFITFQLAGDLFGEPTLDQQIASGFNRLNLVIDAGTALPEESFHRNVVDRVNAFGTALLGLTVGCAVCHDHKYDPLTQKEFYQLYAFFNNIDSPPEAPGAGVHPPFIRFPTDEQKDQISELDGRISRHNSKIQELKATLKRVTEAADQAADSPSDEAASTTADLESAERTLKTLTDQRTTLENELPVTLIMKERSEVRPTHIRIRGAYDQLGEIVQRSTPAFLPPMPATKEVKTRLDLANWVTDPSHPLTARVAVNRFWQQLFGVGLVKTSEDFGTRGEWPSHSDLLDDLAVQFTTSGWNVKLLIKSMVMSETYRQSSQADSESFRSDPQNRLLARGSRFRLDAEMIRDQLLSVSGLLVPTMYGRSVKPPQPPNLWKTISMVSSTTYSFSADTGNKIHRRSVYCFWKRAMPPPQMTIFDAPTRESCIARRERTNTPLQALVLMNENQYFKATRHLAIDVLSPAKMTDQQRINVAYESVTSQLPDDIELATLTAGLDSLKAAYRNDVPSAKTLTADDETLNDDQRIEIAAYTMLLNSLFNLDITKTRE
jgi:hypothetical protein